MNKCDWVEDGLLRQVDDTTTGWDDDRDWGYRPPPSHTIEKNPVTTDCSESLFPLLAVPDMELAKCASRPGAFLLGERKARPDPLNARYGLKWPVESECASGVDVISEPSDSASMPRQELSKINPCLRVEYLRVRTFGLVRLRRQALGKSRRGRPVRPWP